MRQLVFTEYEWNEKFRDVAAAAFDPIAEEFSDRSGYTIPQLKRILMGGSK